MRLLFTAFKKLSLIISIVVCTAFFTILFFLFFNTSKYGVYFHNVKYFGNYFSEISVKMEKPAPELGRNGITTPKTNQLIEFAPALPLHRARGGASEC